MANKKTPAAGGAAGAGWGLELLPAILRGPAQPIGTQINPRCSVAAPAACPRHAPCPLTADRGAAPLQHRQQASRWAQHRYQQAFGCVPDAHLQWRCGARRWQPFYSRREVALMVGLLPVEVGHG